MNLLSQHCHMKSCIAVYILYIKQLELTTKLGIFGVHGEHWYRTRNQTEL